MPPQRPLRASKTGERAESHGDTLGPPDLPRLAEITKIDHQQPSGRTTLRRYGSPTRFGGQ